MAARLGDSVSSRPAIQSGRRHFTPTITPQAPPRHVPRLTARRTGRIQSDSGALSRAASMPALDATAANRSLTLLAVGSGDTEQPDVGWLDGVCEQKSILPATEERRRFQRVKVHLLGRYMLPDRREFPCQIINMSPGGSRCCARHRQCRRSRDRLSRPYRPGRRQDHPHHRQRLCDEHRATARKRDKLAAQLTWLANRDILNLPEDRRHDRIIPRNPIALLTLEDGTKMTCRIIDMSLSGAAIAAENRPPLKSMVLLGKVQSRVVRNLEEGFALEFVHQQIAETLEDNVTAR